MGIVNETATFRQLASTISHGFWIHRSSVWTFARCVSVGIFYRVLTKRRRQLAAATTTTWLHSYTSLLPSAALFECIKTQIECTTASVKVWASRGLIQDINDRWRRRRRWRSKTPLMHSVTSFKVPIIILNVEEAPLLGVVCWSILNTRQRWSPLTTKTTTRTFRSPLSTFSAPHERIKHWLECPRWDWMKVTQASLL